MTDQTPNRIFIIGAMHVDEIASTDTQYILGESNPVRWTQRVGGAAANAARAASASKPNSRITLLANCGDSAIGQSLQSRLQSHGVEVLTTSLGNTDTGRYSAVVQPNGEVLIGLADVSQAEEITTAHILKELSKQQIGVILFDGNLSASTMTELSLTRRAELTRNHHTDYSPKLMAVSVSPGKVHRLLRSLSSLDVLFCNRREALTLANKIDPSADGSNSASLNILSAQGCSHIVMTDGPHGIYIQSNEECSFLPTEPIHAPHTLNGPGDALAGATAAVFSTKNLTHENLAASVLKTGIPAAKAVLTGDALAPLIDE